MRKAIITGATGFIGSALTKRLLSDGITVYGVGLNKDKLEQMKQYGDFIPVVANFDFYVQLPQLINDSDIDVCYHFAWDGVFGNSFKDYDLQLKNAKYACDSLMAAVKLKCNKFVLAGTSNQYTIATRLKENFDESRYTCIYGAAKVAADMMCKTLAHYHDINYNSGLVCMAYGEGNRSKMLPNIVINQFNKGIRPKLVEAENEYDLIYIKDIVDAFIAIAEKGIDQKSYYVGHRDKRTFGEIIGSIRDVLAPDMELIFGEYKETSDMDYSLIDRDALFRDTGFECKADFRESILKTAEWVKTLDL